MADYTRPELIVPALRETDPAGIIEELSRQLQDNKILDDVLTFYHAVLTQEFLANSALSAGIAVPHARTPKVARLTVAVGRTIRPVVWGIRKSWAIDFVFLIAVPPTCAMDHLSLLSGIAGLGHNQLLLSKLREAVDSHVMFDLLKGIRVTHAPLATK
jgi:mannitol/fructose-specific phosphotransferase system IIA component (Ntr-type)